MKYLSSLLGLLILVCFQLLGEACTKFFKLPLPGPVLGMFFLFLSLFAIKPLYNLLSFPSHFLLRRMSLFFIPAGVGIMTLLDRIQAELLPLLSILILSTLITLVVSSYAFHVIPKKEKAHD